MQLLRFNVLISIIDKGQISKKKKDPIKISRSPAISTNHNPHRPPHKEEENNYLKKKKNLDTDIL